MTLTVATTILQQLGGKRFIVMTGCKDFVGSENSLFFKLPKKLNNITHVRITLDCDDTYQVEFTRWVAKSLEHRIESRKTGIYCDMLQEEFTNETGLYTKL